MKSLPDKSVDGIFTDPPWFRKTRRHGSFKLINDEEDRWLELIKEASIEAARILKDNGKFLLWISIIYVGKVIKVIEALEYRWMFFVRYIPPRYVIKFESYFDPILYFAPFGSIWPGKNRNNKYKPSEYIAGSKRKKYTLHPCARPHRSVKNILFDWFKPGEYVIDPFAGSDTMGYAARELNLRWDTCEIDPEMYKTGLQRHAQYKMFETEDSI